jgi:hypothetical protein
MQTIYQRRFDNIESFNKFLQVLIRPVKVISIQQEGESPYGEWLIVWYQEI